MSMLQSLHASQLVAPFTRHASVDDYVALLALVAAGLSYLTKGVLWSKPDPFAYKLYERPQQVLGAKSTERQSRDITRRLEESNANIAVLWASQSGTAEQFARRLVVELVRSLGAKAIFLDVSDIDPESYVKLPQHCMLLFLASTFGEGDPSDNMHELWTWLDKNSSLSDMRYLAFGLGNSNYKHYNHVIDVLVSRLSKRGAQLLFPVGKADGANGETEEHFMEWKEKLLEFMESEAGYQRQPYPYEPGIEVTEDASLQLRDVHYGAPIEPQTRQRSSRQSVVPLVICETRELFHADSGRNCLHMEFDVTSHPDLKYKTGDYIDVWPINPTEEVTRLIDLLGLEERRDNPVRIISLDGNRPQFPTPTTLEALFAHYLEICGPVSREHIGMLAPFSSTSEARSVLERLSQDKSAYQTYTTSRYVNLGRLLEHASNEASSWASLPLSMVLEMLKPMKPRSYSISSSSVVQPRRVALTAVVSNTKLPEEQIPGLATNYLLATGGNHPHGMSYSCQSVQQATPTNYVHAALRKSTFKLPVVPSIPIVMIGAGTGVAPFRAFLHERARLKTMGREVGQTLLFFGCRHPKQDFIYRSEFDELSHTLDGVFTMHTAFSRPTDGQAKSYVQDRILEQRAVVSELLVEEKAYLYVCGSAAMAREVSNAVNALLLSTQGWSEDEAEEFGSRQRRQRRWLQDVWG